jgi:hypothetical protein
METFIFVHDENIILDYINLKVNIIELKKLILYIDSKMLNF